MKNWISLCVLGIALGACAIPMRSQKAPQIRPMPSLSSSGNQGAWPERSWWKVFGDAQLDRLVAEGLKNNPGLAATRTRLRSANAAVRAARAALGTRFAADSSLEREKLSANGLFPPPLGGSSFTQSQLSASASRELDLWHENRDLIAASVSARAAQSAEIAEARLLLTRAIVNAYFAWTQDAAIRHIRTAELKRSDTLLRFAKMAYRAGAGSQQSVMAARAEVASAHLQRDTAGERVDADRVALAALLGHGPRYGRTITPATSITVPVPALPPDLRLDLLARRPDIAGRYWTVRAAAARVGAAKAGFYPNISLSAMGGVQSLTLSQLLSASSLMGTAGIAVHLPLFEPDTLKARLTQARADYDQAVDEYNNAVVTAARNVASDLVRIDALRREQRDLADLRSAHARELAIAQHRYRVGAASIIPVLEAQNGLARIEVQQQTLTGARAEALASLLGAL
ncbi:MAG TPA: efflux transporter outer membrane subunit, partial [Acidiferrobacteraceae bacterium]|nr:efflux transporter outer membrane subunit [Acidiferrobacteraceae bacterium]